MSADTIQFRSDPRIDAEYEGTATLLIPDDVMKAAVDAGWAATSSCNPTAVNFDPKPIARALLAERERCAKIAQFANVRPGSAGQREVAERIRHPQPNR